MSRAAARGGVSPSCIALPPGDWPTVLAFLQQRFAHVTADDWRERMERGEVLDAQGLTLNPDAAYRPHAKLFYYRSLAAEQPIPFEEQILFQDELLVAVDKPHFLPVTPGGRYLQETLLVRLKRRLGLDELQPLHRLDRETAGLVLFSVQPTTRNAYHGLFREREVSKCYEAIAPWRDDLPLPMTRSSRLAEGESFMRMREVPGEPNAHTRISLLERQGGLARYRLEPETGQRHQLRVHMCALGLPIVNDQIYPVHQPELAENDYSRPLQLLARTLAFTDPVSGEARCFESGLSLQF
ncbi:MAG: pseudouridine synthase [Burkholderiaceae bacterium]|nr:pseudouridine synthase [Burkholderiaceae bacterium]